MSNQRIDRLYFVTASRNKFNDYEFLLGKYADLYWSRLNIEDPVTNDLAILIRRKVETARLQLPHLPFLVEQTNLQIKSWKGLPGNVTSLFINGIGVEGICKMLQAFEDRSAKVVTDLAYHAPDGKVQIFRGELNGRIADGPRGEKVFGWDAIFVPEGQNATFAEMDLEDRHTISTRKVAVTAFIEQALQEQEAAALLRNRIQLRELMKQDFNMPELNELCYEIGVDIEELRGGTKTEMVQELILHCERSGSSHILLERCNEKRPNTKWPDKL